MHSALFKFSQFFLDLGQNLPFLTRALIGLSQWSKKAWVWIVPLLGLLILYFSRMWKNEKEKAKLDRFFLKIPKVVELIIKTQVARLGRTLGLLLQSGMPVLDAMKVALPVLTNEAVRSDLQTCCKVLEDGGYFSDGLKRSKLFPAFVFQLIGIGEESGKLDEALTEVAEWYEQEIDESIKMMTNLLEPIIILVLGLILGVIVLAVLLPVFSLNALAQ